MIAENRFKMGKWSWKIFTERKMLAILLHGMKGTLIFIREKKSVWQIFILMTYQIIRQHVYKERLDQGFSKEDILRSIHKKHGTMGGRQCSGHRQKMQVLQKSSMMKVNPIISRWMLQIAWSIRFHLLHISDADSSEKESRVLRQGTYRLIDRENPNIFSYERILEIKRSWSSVIFIRKKPSMKFHWKEPGSDRQLSWYGIPFRNSLSKGIWSSHADMGKINEKETAEAVYFLSKHMKEW